MTHPEKVAFVGVGRMGANMARRLKDCGFTIAAVYDTHAPAAQELGVSRPTLYDLMEKLGIGKDVTRDGPR